MHGDLIESRISLYPFDCLPHCQEHGIVGFGKGGSDPERFALVSVFIFVIFMFINFASIDFASIVFLFIVFVFFKSIYAIVLFRSGKLHKLL